MEPLIAPAGWCAPSDQVYDFFPDRFEQLPEAECPEWTDPEGTETCKSHSFWTGEVESRGWHSCKDEFTEPHDICICEDCGQKRVVLRES